MYKDFVMVQHKTKQESDPGNMCNLKLYINSGGIKKNLQVNGRTKPMFGNHEDVKRTMAEDDEHQE